MPVGNPLAANLFKIAVLTSAIAPLGAPNGVPSAAGGTVAAGTYYGKVTAINAVGESIGSYESVGIVTGGATSSIVWTWAPVPGATSYRLYVGTAPGAEGSYFASAGAANTVTQTTTAGTAGAIPGIAAQTFVPLSLMNSFDVSGAENVAGFDTFDSDDPIEFAGKQRRTLSASGYLADSTDSGQAALFAAAAAKTPVGIRGLWDGATNGFFQVCRVNAYKAGTRAGNNPTTASFDFLPLSAAGVVIGTGPLL